MKPLTSFLLVSGFWLLVTVTHAGVELQSSGSSRKNTLKGYDFYDSSGKKTGYSMSNRRGGYDFYDVHGNKTSSTRQADKSIGGYNFHDASGIKKGSLKKAPSGEYIYKDKLSGKEARSAPQFRGGLGSLSPDEFQGKRR